MLSPQGEAKAAVRKVDRLRLEKEAPRGGKVIETIRLWVVGSVQTYGAFI